MSSELEDPKEGEATMESTADDQAADQAVDVPESNESAQTETSETENNSQKESETADPVEAHVPQFTNLQDTSDPAHAPTMGRLYDVSVQVAAELGSVRLPIGDVLKLGEGSVLELNRSISEPIDLVAQGIRIAKGEVVVIDDCFAIRIKEIESKDQS